MMAWYYLNSGRPSSREVRMDTKKSNKEKAVRRGLEILSTIIFMSAGFLVGIFATGPVIDTIHNKGIGSGLIMSGLLFIIIVILVFFHIIVHEAGHLVFGKISGYDFVSFRIASLMLIKEDDKLKLKKYNIVGTGGQCLMVPKSEWNAYDYPYVLYNLGGSLANLIVGLISIVLYVMVPGTIYLSEVLFLSFVVGILLALTNGIPMKVSGISNDGHNILSLNKDKQARRALYLQLYINGMQSNGTRLKEMPEAYFELPDNPDLTNPLIVAIGVFKCNYLHDKQEFTEAESYAKYLINNAPGLLGIYKNELTCELLFYEIIGLCRQDEIEILYSKELEAYIKGTSGYVSRRRLMYAYEIFVNNDKDRANKELEEFDKAATKYPYTGEIEAEWELIEFVKNLAKIKNVSWIR